MAIADTDPSKVREERFGAKDGEGEQSPSRPISGKGSRGPRGPYKPRAGKTAAPAVKPERTKEEKENGAKLCAFLAATLWDMAAPFMKRRELTDEEALRLGGALDPVLDKYLPSMANYALEINLLVTVAFIFQSTQLPKTDGAPRLEIVGDDDANGT